MVQEIRKLHKKSGKTQGILFLVVIMYGKHRIYMYSSKLDDHGIQKLHRWKYFTFGLGKNVPQGKVREFVCFNIRGSCTVSGAFSKIEKDVKIFNFLREQWVKWFPQNIKVTICIHLHSQGSGHS